MECTKAWECMLQELDGSLPAEDCRELMLHLAFCPECRELHLSLATPDWTCLQETPPEGFEQEVMKKIEQSLEACGPMPPATVAPDGGDSAARLPCIWKAGGSASIASPWFLTGLLLLLVLGAVSFLTGVRMETEAISRIVGTRTPGDAFSLAGAAVSALNMARHVLMQAADMLERVMSVAIQLFSSLPAHGGGIAARSHGQPMMLAMTILTITWTILALLRIVHDQPTCTEVKNHAA